MEAKFQTFAGMVPLVDKRLLNPNYAQLVRDCELDSGNIRPIREPSFVAELTDPFQKATYRYEDPAFPDGHKWLDWIGGPVSVFKSPVSNDQYNRIYYIDPADQKLKVRSGNTEYVAGVPRPTAPKVVSKPRPPNSWIRIWGYWHESLAGVKLNEGTYFSEVDLPANSGTNKWTPGTDSSAAPAGQSETARASNWYISKAHHTAHAGGPTNSLLIPFFRAYTKIDKSGTDQLSNRGIDLGTLIPKRDGDTVADRSQNRGQSDFGINGVKCNAVYKRNNDDVIPDVWRMTYESAGATMTTAYVVTFINIFGEESEPSDPTSNININPFSIGQLSQLDTGSAHSEAGYAPITKLRVYRVVTGNETATFKFVGDIDLTSVPSTWDDLAFDVEAGETLSTVGATKPEVGMSGLVHVAGGFFAAYKGNSLFFSHPYHPYSWPLGYELTFPYTVKALGVSGNTVAVLTDEHPFLVTGYEPATMQEAKMAIPFPCVNPYVCEWGGAILYISNEGLIALNGQQGINLTEKYWSRNQWLAMKPETMLITAYKERIYLFAALQSLETYNRPAVSVSGYESYVVYPNDERKAVNALSTYVQGIWNDLSRDALYVIRGTSVYQIEGGPNFFESRYVTKEMQYNSPTAPSIIRVNAEGYPVKVTFIANGQPVQTIVISDDHARKVPRMRMEKFWSIQVDSRFVIREVLVATAMRVLQ